MLRESEMQNAKCKMQNRAAVPFCILHFAFCIGASSHPYTRGLLASPPSVTKDGASRLPTIKGMVPAIHALPSGCKFNPRCPDVMEICYGNEPALMNVGEGHTARCYLHGNEADAERVG